MVVFGVNVVVDGMVVFGVNVVVDGMVVVDANVVVAGMVVMGARFSQTVCDIEPGESKNISCWFAVD